MFNKLILLLLLLFFMTSFSRIEHVQLTSAFCFLWTLTVFCCFSHEKLSENYATICSRQKKKFIFTEFLVRNSIKIIKKESGQTQVGLHETTNSIR